MVSFSESVNDNINFNSNTSPCLGVISYISLVLGSIYVILVTYLFVAILYINLCIMYIIGSTPCNITTSGIATSSILVFWSYATLLERYSIVLLTTESISYDSRFFNKFLVTAISLVMMSVIVKLSPSLNS